MKKKIIAIILACILLLLEALPIGAALHITNAEGRTVLFAHSLTCVLLLTVILNLLLLRFCPLRFLCSV